MIRLEKLIEIAEKFKCSMEDLDVRTGGKVRDGRDDYKWAESYIVLRFGYWRRIDIEILQELVGPAYTIVEDMTEDDDGGGSWIYRFSYELIRA